MVMDMEHGRFNITPPEGRRCDGGGICIIKEAKQVSPLTLPTSKPPQDDLLGRTHSGRGMLAPDIIRATRKTIPGANILPRHPPVVGEHLAMGAPTRVGGRIMDK